MGTQGLCPMDPERVARLRGYIGKLGMRELSLDMREPKPSRKSGFSELAISKRNQPQVERTNFHYQRPSIRSV